MLASESGRKTIPYSFRIDNEIYLELESEARKNNISINMLLNQISKEHLFSKNYEKIGCMLVPIDVMRDVFDSTNEKLLIKNASKLGSNHATEYIQLLYHNVTKQTATQFLDMWFRRFHGFEHKIHGSIHSFSILHDINEKYSLFMKEFVKSFCETILHEPVKIQTTQRTITFSFSV